MTSLVLEIDGKNYSGWESLDLTISMENLSGSFIAGLTDNIVDNVPISKTPIVIPGQTCLVKLNGNTVINGFIDKVTPSYSDSTHSIIAAGRDTTCDLVDCSMVQTISQWIGLTIDQIIKNICKPFGITVTVDSSVNVGAPFTNFVVEQGSSCFEIIQKLCFMRQLLAISDGKGGLLLTIAGTKKSPSSLQEGVNIKAAQADYDFSERYNLYMCKGQMQGDDFSSPTVNVSPVGQYKDTEITRYRPILIIAEGQANINDCTQRAKWEAAIRRGKSKKLTVTVNGWSQADGSLWTINQLVSIVSPRLGVNDSLLISQCNFKLDENGQITILTLTSPEAYTLNSSKLIKSNAQQKSNPYISG